jgi:hypothetical protein
MMAKRVAQLVIAKHERIIWKSRCNETERGSGGFTEYRRIICVYLLTKNKLLIAEYEWLSTKHNFRQKNIRILFVFIGFINWFWYWNYLFFEFSKSIVLKNLNTIDSFFETL